MLHAIDALFLIGVLSNAVKLGDLLLLESQRKWLQDKFEHWTIALDDIRPWHWIRLTTTKTLVRTGSTVGSLVALCACVYYKYPLDYTTNPITRLGYATNWGRALGISIHVLLGLLVMAVIFGTTKTEARWGIEGLFRTKDSNDFWRGLSKFVFAYILLLALYRGVDWLITKFLFLLASQAVVGFFHVIFDIVTFPVYVAITPALVVAILFGVTAYVLSTLTLILSVLRAIAWRIATYAKGVFAALLLLLTFGLGIAELALRPGG